MNVEGPRGKCEALSAQECSRCSTTKKTSWPSSRSASARLGGIFDVAGKEARLSELEAILAAPDLWDDNERAQGLLKERTQVQQALERLSRPGEALDDAEVMIELGEAESDSSVGDDVRDALKRADVAIGQLEFTRMLGGAQDGNDAILTVNAGAGGTDSQDWAEMLFRMYTRYCERQGWKIEMLDRQDGEEAGIKSASIAVRGDWAYGMLRSEAGVHRLVRISPFDSNARRHTAFAAAFVYPELDDDIEVEINESDLRVDTYRASGAGGQHVNKTDSAVRIVHEPTGVVVQCQAERSQHKNRAKAMKMLKARLYQLEIDRQNAERDAVEAGKQDIAFGSQIRNYVLHPYQIVKDLRTNTENSNVNAVLDGDLEPFVKSYLIAFPSG